MENLALIKFGLKKSVKIVVKSGLFLGIFFNGILISDFYRAETNNLKFERISRVTSDYIKSRNDLEGYIIDTGDYLSIEFFPAFEFSNLYPVNESGEILLPRLKETYVRGLTPLELQKILLEKYKSFLRSPEINVRLAIFRKFNVQIKGEINNPGFYSFPAFKSSSYPGLTNLPGLTFTNAEKVKLPNLTNINGESVKLSNLILRAGGITAKSDLSRVQIIRNIPIGQGGGKKNAKIDFRQSFNKLNIDNDIRLQDGDMVFIPELNQANHEQISKSIVSRLTPKFIEVQIYGMIKNPGKLKLPLESSLSDALDLTGPIVPLSGKVVLIRYESEGTFFKKTIPYSSNARRGSRRNPYIKNGDIINIRQSKFQQGVGLIKGIAAPFSDIKEIKDFLEDDL